MTVTRHFVAHLVEAESHPRPCALEAETFEHAAIAFAERWGEADGELRVVVTDDDTGEEQCFTVALGSGEARAC